MDFPRFVFISPGKQQCQGGTYDHELTVSKTDYDAALRAGYSANVPDALADKKDVVLLKLTGDK